MPLTSRMTISQSAILKKNQSKELDFDLFMWSVVPCEVTNIPLKVCKCLYKKHNLCCFLVLFFFSQPTITDILHLGWWASAAAW